MRGGFTLVEVAVALVILALGLMGAAGLVTVAARTLGAAREMEAAAGLILEVADSLADAGVTGSGGRVDFRGRVTWSVEEPGPPVRVRLVARAAPRSSGVTVVTLLPPPAPGP